VDPILIAKRPAAFPLEPFENLPSHEDPHSNDDDTAMEMVASRGVGTTPIPQMVGLDSEEQLLWVSTRYLRCACVAVCQLGRSGHMLPHPFPL